MRRKLRTNAGEVCSCFFNVLLHDRDRDILFLHDAVCFGCFVQKHSVIFLTVVGQRIQSVRHENVLFKVDFVESVIIDRELCGRSAVERVQQFGIRKEHRLFIFLTCHKVIDVGKLIGLGKLISALKNAVFPNAADRDIVMDTFGNYIFFLVLLEHIFE